MDFQVRSFSVFFESKKLGQFHSGTLTVDGGDSENFGDNGGVVVFGDGIRTTKLSAQVYEPITGLDFDIETMMLNKTNLNISVGLINGRVYTIKGMRCMSMKHTGTVRDGKLEGDFEFAGSAPNIASLTNGPV